MDAGLVVVLLVGSNSACLFLGYLFGRMARATVQMEESMAADTPDVAREAPMSAPVGRRRLNAFRLLAWTVALIGAVTTAMGYVVIRNQDRLVGCVVGYSNASSAAAKARSAAQNDVNTQIDNVMAAFQAAFTDAPAVGRDRVFGAIDAYNKARAKAKETQRDNPLPDPPEDACAELID